MNIGEKLLKLRTDNGRTLNEEAEFLGIAKSSISNWERGAYKPGTSSLKKYAEKYNLPLTYFLDNGKKDNSPELLKGNENDVENQIITLYKKLPNYRKYAVTLLLLAETNLHLLETKV